MEKSTLANLILRLGVAFSFVYAGVAGFYDPNSWIGFFPDFARGIISDSTLLSSWGIFEIALALWIISGKNIFIPSILASLSLTGLIIFNLGAMDIIFRDVTILSATIALTVLNYHRKTPAQTLL